MLSLPEAIYRMSGFTALHMGIAKRGLIRPGYYADLVLFYLQRIRDRATTQQPLLTATGISRVWVNGRLVLDKGKATGILPGMVVRR